MCDGGWSWDGWVRGRVGGWFRYNLGISSAVGGSMWGVCRNIWEIVLMWLGDWLVMGGGRSS